MSGRGGGLRLARSRILVGMVPCDIPSIDLISFVIIRLLRFVYVIYALTALSTFLILRMTCVFICFSVDKTLRLRHPS